ncbi:MAG: sodium:proton antiporter [Myxococcales bacterium]|nr:sodium:proton antiporter [Myxococcales bacterium]
MRKQMQRVLTASFVAVFCVGFWSPSAAALTNTVAIGNPIVAEAPKKGNQTPPSGSHEKTDAHGKKDGHGKGTTKEHGRVPTIYEVIPFLLLLLGIALIPLINGHFWESNLNKGLVAGLCSAPILINLLIVNPNPHALLHAGEEFIAFIVLLWSLFTISGGIVLRGNIPATPLTNTIFLAIGAVIANIFGTTGAAMLLIRPVLKTNRERRHKKHTVIFFIFLVANVGGCLTPLGDPPLFLGFLRGVPFEWTLKLWPMWLVKTALVLTIYYVWDTFAHKKESMKNVARDEKDVVPLRLEGSINFLFIAGVVLAIIFGKNLKALIHGSGATNYFPYGELVMIAMGLLSMRFTSKKLRKDNDFNFHAIIEVAVLFAGIFIVMIPALDLLRAKGGSLGIKEPWQFFWATGLLSSFLDNAPTYLTFVSLGQGVTQVGDNILALATHPHHMVILKAISVGAVFMGANTYIGNAPNFMVKAIAETAPGESRVTMPSFFGYMAYSFGILVPLDIIITLLFFRS